MFTSLYNPSRPALSNVMISHYSTGSNECLPRSHITDSTLHIHSCTAGIHVSLAWRPFEAAAGPGQRCITFSKVLETKAKYLSRYKDKDIAILSAKNVVI